MSLIQNATVGLKILYNDCVTLMLDECVVSYDILYGLYSYVMYDCM